MKVIASYDISVSSEGGVKRLRNIAKAMKRFGFRIQKSVFETNLTMGQFQELIQLAEDLIDPDLDSVVFFRMGECCSHKAVRLGKAFDPLDAEQFVL